MSMHQESWQAVLEELDEMREWLEMFQGQARMLGESMNSMERRIDKLEGRVARMVKAGREGAPADRSRGSVDDTPARVVESWARGKLAEIQNEEPSEQNPPF